VIPAGSDRPVPGVGVAVISGERILLVRRGREPAAGMWAVPGGKLELGETWREAARREVWEETGVEVEVGEVVWAGDSIGPGDPPAWHYALVDFVGTAVAGEAVAGDDAADVGWFHLEEARRLPLTGTMPELLDALEAGELLGRGPRHG
jgi:8-oxo-dGTP diphosphatase